MIRIDHLTRLLLACAMVGLATPCAAAVPIVRETVDKSTPAQSPPATQSGQAATAAATSMPVDFEVFLPLRNTAALQQLLTDQQTPGRANYQKWLTPTQYAAQF